MLISRIMNHRRMKILAVILFAAWSGLVMRLFYIQVFSSSSFKQIAQNQQLRDDKIDYYRGDILDRNGKKLATDITYYSFSANPKVITEKWKTAELFRKVFGGTREQYLEQLRKKKSFVWLKRKVQASTADKILAYKLPGIYQHKVYGRLYPSGESMGQITGFTNIDNKGIEGLELIYNDVLAGATGSQTLKRDGLGRRTVDFNFPIENAVDGNSVITTIDLNCQTIAIEELAKGVKQFNAKAGTVILMNPHTGEILALASIPTFDSNSPGKFNPEARRNRAVTDSFEPGSIFKLVPIAAALEKNLVTPETIFFCENGHVMVGRHRFRDTKPHGNLTVKEIMSLSSNIGAYKIAQMLGPASYYGFIRDFGFAQKIGIELSGEAPGFVRKPSKWSKTSLSALSIGQEISVNALQIAAAYGVVANGGILVKPYMIKSITDTDGNVVQNYTPQKIRRVISENTAKTLTDFFVSVVEEGTAEKAKIPGKEIAGKTGTAQKVDPERKILSQTDYMSSFVAFYPAKNPRIVGLVVLDTPKPSYFGGSVAAPIMKNIINRLTYIPGNNILAEKLPFVNESSETLTFWQKIKNIWKSDEDTISGNAFAAASGKPIAPLKKETKYIDISKPEENEKDKDKAGLLKMPNLKGKTMRDAIKILTRQGLDFEIKGSGIVIDQSPSPGSKIKEGAVTTLKGKNPEELYENR